MRKGKIFLLLCSAPTFSAPLTLEAWGLIDSELFPETTLFIYTHKRYSHRARVLEQEGFILCVNQLSLVTNGRGPGMCLSQLFRISLLMKNLPSTAPRDFSACDLRLGHFNLSEIFHSLFQDTIVYVNSFFLFSQATS